MDNLKALKKSVFFISFPLSFIAFLFPIYAYSTGISVMGISLMYSAFILCTIIMRPVVGIFLDKKGRKPGIVLGIIFYSLVTILFITGEDFQYLMAARIFQGIANSFLWISVDTMISDLSHEQNRSETFGRVNESTNKGNLIGVILGFYMVAFFDGSFRSAFLLYLITSLISLYYAITKLKETKDLKPYYEEEKTNKNKDFNIFLILMGLFALIFSLTGHTYLIYISDIIKDKFHLIAYLFLPGAILSLFLPNKFGKISDRYSREKIFIISILAIGILYLFIPAVKSYSYFLIINTIIDIFSILEGPAESALVIDIVGENQRGKSYGKYKFAVRIGGMLGPLAGGYIYEKIGSEVSFYVKGVLLVILCVFTAIYFRKLKGNSPQDKGEDPISTE